MAANNSLVEYTMLVAEVHEADIHASQNEEPRSSLVAVQCCLVQRRVKVV